MFAFILALYLSFTNAVVLADKDLGTMLHHFDHRSAIQADPIGKFSVQFPVTENYDKAVYSHPSFVGYAMLTGCGTPGSAPIGVLPLGLCEMWRDPEDSKSYFGWLSSDGVNLTITRFSDRKCTKDPVVVNTMESGCEGSPGISLNVSATIQGPPNLKGTLITG